MSGGGKQVKQTPQEKDLLELAQRQYSDWKDSYVPVEDAYIDRVKSFDSQGERDQLSGMAANEVRQSAPAPGAAPGVDPSGGNYQGARMGLGAQMGDAVTNATNTADQAVVARGATGKVGLVGLGKGLQGTAAQTSSRSAALALADESAKQVAKNERAQSQMAAVGTAVGLGVGAYTGARKPQTVQMESMGGYDVNQEDFWR